jgi:K+/H+ antiporter YhaU regulatory subunit KhtT
MYQFTMKSGDKVDITVSSKGRVLVCITEPDGNEAIIALTRDEAKALSRSLATYAEIAPV